MDVLSIVATATFGCLFFLMALAGYVTPEGAKGRTDDER